MRADIFCKRIDHYGDIGVCWRLAQHLQQRAKWQVRLWIDDLFTFSRLAPRCNPHLAYQRLANIDVIAWTLPLPAYLPGDVVIETFGCDPPSAFRAAMRRQRPIWINLEYLSAETWVETHHGLPSLQADHLTKYFFFPGFTSATGGLLREPKLRQHRQAFQQSRRAQLDFLKQLTFLPDSVFGASTLSPSVLSTSTWGQVTAPPRLITLFCYPEAPLNALLRALHTIATPHPHPTLLLIPEGVAPTLRPEDARPPLKIVRIPFLSQEDYDHLLWCADLNIVRGEDSFIRAGWAARPLIWQPYLQTENTHLKKLDAWLARYAPPLAAQQLIRSWNHANPSPPLETAWQTASQDHHWIDWQTTAIQWEHEQAAYPDLATHLIEFCTKLSFCTKPHEK